MAEPFAVRGAEEGVLLVLPAVAAFAFGGKVSGRAQSAGMEGNQSGQASLAGPDRDHLAIEVDISA